MAAKSKFPMMETTMEIVGPQKALVLLKSNVGNRPVNDATVDRYAADMKAGLWKTTYEPIAIAADGRILNGQHRLYAIIQSGATCTFAVARNVDPSVFDVVDIGRRRTGGDHFAIAFGETEHNPGKLAAVCKASVARMKSGGKSSRTNDCGKEARDVYEGNTGLVNAMVAAFGTKARAPTVASAINCVLDGFAEFAPVIDVANRFRERNFMGIGDPLSALNDTLNTNTKMDGGECYAVTVTALQAALTGQKLKILRPSKLDWSAK